MTKKKKILLVIVALVGLLVLVDLIRYPLVTTAYQLSGQKRDEVVAIEIWHYGKTIRVEDPQQVEEILTCMDGVLLRGKSDYIVTTTGGADYAVYFVNDAGEKTRGFGLLPGIEKDKIKYWDYYYSCRENGKFEPIFQIWDEMNP